MKPSTASKPKPAPDEHRCPRCAGKMHLLFQFWSCPRHCETKPPQCCPKCSSTQIEPFAVWGSMQRRCVPCGAVFPPEV